MDTPTTTEGAAIAKATIIAPMSPVSQHPPPYDPRDDHEHDLALAPDKIILEPPPLYQVLLLNDDFTPMEFVVHVLRGFFDMDEERATRVMLHVHTRGRGICGVYTREIAETKVMQVNEFSRMNQHPLACTMEPA